MKCYIRQAEHWLYDKNFNLTGRIIIKYHPNSSALTFERQKLFGYGMLTGVLRQSDEPDEDELDDAELDDELDGIEDLSSESGVPFPIFDEFHGVNLSVKKDKSVWIEGSKEGDYFNVVVEDVNNLKGLPNKDESLGKYLGRVGYEKDEYIQGLLQEIPECMLEVSVSVDVLGTK